MASVAASVSESVGWLHSNPHRHWLQSQWTKRNMRKNKNQTNWAKAGWATRLKEYRFDGSKSNQWLLWAVFPQVDVGAKTDNYIYINNLDDGTFILITFTDNTKLGQQWICWRLLLPLERDLDKTKEWANKNLRSSTVIILHLGQNNPMQQYGLRTREPL